MHNLIIWVLSTVVLLIGIVNLPKKVHKGLAIGLLSFSALINLVDNISGDQTTLRQYAYLFTAVVVVAYSLIKRR